MDCQWKHSGSLGSQVILVTQLYEREVPPIPEMEKNKPQQNKYWGIGCDNNYKNSKNNYAIESNNRNKCNGT